MSPGAGFDLHPLESVKLPDVIENDLADVPPAGITMAKPSQHQNIVMHDEWKRAVQAYLASFSFVDAPIGRLLDAAERRASKRDFIIVLWSDHGWNLGQEERWHKVALWENTTHVPLIMSVPGITEPGSRCERPVDLLSLKVATFKGGRSGSLRNTKDSQFLEVPTPEG
jgi:arylsulfatase A-like enzyme